MNSALVSSELVELLSKIIGQKLLPRDINFSLIFSTTLLTILTGVISADGQVTSKETQNLKKIINNLFPEQQQYRQKAKILINGIFKEKIYINFDQIVILATPLLEEQKLLILSCGYQMLAVDDVDSNERRYLKVITKRLQINPNYQQLIKNVFINKNKVDLSILEEVKSLIHPSRFQDLDIIFIKTAKNIYNYFLEITPVKETNLPTSGIKISYNQLHNNKKYRAYLQEICNQISKTIEPLIKQGIILDNITEELIKIKKKIESTQFRIAVVGEFSQGKSTLLNALLGEEVQPVREIPCSGTITILKYGTKKRVICHYKDGRQQEISIKDYHKKATIEEEYAIGNISQGLAELPIKEIIFEHPNLELCSHGVCLIDSPGLNEHPDRTSITQQMLKDIDAIIFLTNANRPLTQGERELIIDLKKQINIGKSEQQPANNLFIVVNFWDLVRTEKGGQQIKQRIEKFVNESKIITGENRIHYISAQSTLDAILHQTNNEYLTAFQKFTQSLENFLTIERSHIELKLIVDKINNIIKNLEQQLEQYDKKLNRKTKISEEAKKDIIEQIGIITGCDGRLHCLVDNYHDLVLEDLNEAWHNWSENLFERLAAKIPEWSSENSLFWSKEEVIKDYQKCFLESFKKEVSEWEEKYLKPILRDYLTTLDQEINTEIEFLKKKTQLLDEKIDSNLIQQVNYLADNIEIDGSNGLFTISTIGVIIGGGLAIAFPITGIIIGILGGGLGIFSNQQEADQQAKIKVFEQSLEYLETKNVLNNIIDQIVNTVQSAFNTRFKEIRSLMDQTILSYNNLLAQEEKNHQKTANQRQQEKNKIKEQILTLNKIKQKLSEFLTKLQRS